MTSVTGKTSECNTNRAKPEVINRREVVKRAVSLTALAALPLAATKPTYAQPGLDIDDFISTLIADYNLPGAGVAFVEDATLAWHKSFGVTNVSTEQPVTETTLFQAASLSKPIFAYVVLKATENGELSLDDRLVKYYRPDDLVSDAFAEKVTVRDALQHTSGLPNWRPDEDGPQPLKLNYEPGTDTSYSGEAYHWLQRVMEAITGDGLDVIMRKRLFEPAGLSDMQMLWSADRDGRETYYHVIDNDGQLAVDTLQYRRALGWKLHEVAEKWGRPMKMWTWEDQVKATYEMSPFMHPRMKRQPAWYWRLPTGMMIDSPSSLRCTPADYAKFVALMLPGRRRESFELSDAMREMMLTPQYERPRVQNGVLPRGLGWGLEKRHEGVVFYHWGKNGPSHHALAVGDPMTRKGIVVMVHGPNGPDFMREVVTTLMGKNYIGVIT
ncbi:MAG: serine hydrolase domain-containing protein [Pseudomonadota bacterium]